MPASRVSSTPLTAVSPVAPAAVRLPEAPKKRGSFTPMTELTIRPEEIRDALASIVSSYDAGATRDEVGVVTETGDGIARVEGLHSCMTNELLEFEGGVLGLALNLDVREIGCVILGDAHHIEEGQEVRRTGEILSIPVGDAFL